MALDSKIPNIPEELRDRLVEGNVVLFVGSGLSIAAGAPTWSEMLERLADEAKRQDVDLSGATDLADLLRGPPHDKILAAGWLRKKLDSYFGSVIEREFGELAPHAAHEQISKLRLHGIVTTNYDRLLEMVLPELTVVLPTSHWDPYQPGFLLKLHGTCRPDPMSVVIAPDDYRDVLSNAVLMDNMRQLYRRYTFLFVGFGLADPDTIATLEPLKDLLGARARQHYALLDEGEVGPIRKQGLRDQLGVQMLPYRTRGDHEEVVTFLSELADIGADTTTRWLLLVGGRRDAPPSTQLLVKEATDGWAVNGVLPYMLPNLPYVDDLDEVRRRAAVGLGLPEDSVKITPHGDVFSTSNKKPSRKGHAIYRFRFAIVELAGQPDDVIGHFSRVGDRPARWASLTELRNHPATHAVNHDAYSRLSDVFGSALEGLPPAVTLP